ncbi:unnamed protein product, partial [Ectocarpus fasciculatus]
SRLLYLAVAGGSYPESACFAHAQHTPETTNNIRFFSIFEFSNPVSAGETGPRGQDTRSFRGCRRHPRFFAGCDTGR